MQPVLIDIGDGCTDCFEEYKDSIYKEFLIKKSQDITWAFTDFWDTCSTNYLRTTKGACFHYEENGNDSIYVKCSDMYCCRTFIEICYDENGNVIPDSYSVQDDELFGDGAPVNCDLAGCPDGTVECGLMSTGCGDMPCDMGEWLSDTVSIDIDGCPGCSVSVAYNYRETQGCTPQYYDYQIIDEIPYTCDSTCTKTDQEIFAYIMSWLLKYGAHPLPDPGKCIDVYRILINKCWEKDEDLSRYLSCTVADSCCWSQYRICVDGPDTTSTKIDFGGGNLDSAYCEDEPEQVCFFVCGLLPDNRISLGKDFIDNDYCKVYPNPNNGKATIELKSEITGGFIFEIFNNYGILIKKRQIYKDTYFFEFSFSLKNESSGIYYYKITSDAKTIYSGKFILLKQ